MSVTHVHPREDFAPLARVDTQEAAIETALQRGRLHHAWLLCGPRGVGKSRFAYRLARRLLSSRSAADGAISSTDPAARLIAARSHPDFLPLHRESEESKPRRVIPVDEVRRLPEFFAKAPSHAPYRVALIDAVDDLNPSGANAVLKTLEEPPVRGVVILVSHAPGRLLDTIRSRCRRLNFAAWPPSAVEAWLHTQGLEATNARLNSGSPGGALKLGADGTDPVHLAARALFDALPDVEFEALQKIVDGLRGPDGGDRFTTLCERLADHLHARIAALVIARRPGADAWTQVWERLVRTPGEVEALNLERGDALWSLVGELRAVAAASGPA